MLTPTTRIQQLQIESGRRILVTSDIHGYLSYLQGVLEKANFSEKDILIIVGDMLEKGPDSLGTLRYVMELYKKGNVILLLGNVDAYRLQVIDELNEENALGFYDYLVALREWCGSCFYEELAAECGYTIASPADLLSSKPDVLAHFAPEFDFLLSLPTVVETQNYVFVHGGLREKKVEDNRNRPFYDLTKYDAFMTNTPHRFDKYVVVGHWPVPLYDDKKEQLNPVINREKRIISIDGGCGVKDERQLNLLILPDINCDVEDITHLYYEDFPTIRALEDQAASEDSVYISWMTREIRLLERGEAWSEIQHIASGKKLRIPNAYIRRDNECRDYTDYVLPVKAGDMLSVFFKTETGCIAKKDGVVGWYYGPYEDVK